MNPLSVVKLEMGGQAKAGFCNAMVIMKINFFVFDRFPEPLDEDVVAGPTPTVHADRDAVFFKRTDEIRCGNLRSLIHVEIFRVGSLKGFFQGLCTERRIQGDRQLPGQDVTAEPVHDGHKVNKAMIHSDVRDIGTPNLIPMVNFQAPQQIGVLSVLRTGFAQPLLGINGLQVHEPHEPGTRDEHPLRISLPQHRHIEAIYWIGPRIDAGWPGS